MPEDLRSDNPFAIIGEEDAVLGFRALGFKIYAVEENTEFKIALEEVVNQKTPVCLVEESIYRAKKEEINNYKNLPLPIFVPFAKNAGMDLLEEIIKEIRLKAIGTN